MENSTLPPAFDNCVSSVLTRDVFTSWFVVYLLTLPVFLFVLYIGFNKWKSPQSSASGSVSHSDVFTFHMVVMEMVCMVGSCVACYGFFRRDSALVSVGGDMVATTSTGQVLFHSLTCVERYLAVVHPVTYLRLKTRGGVTLRNISIAFVWVFSLTDVLLYRLIKADLLYRILGFVLTVTPAPLVAFCSVQVLCVLIRRKPGEEGRQKRQIDQSKRSTVYTMVAILGALLLRLVVQSVISSLYLSQMRFSGCVLIGVGLWADLPSSLVLPLLFLHRAGKLPGSK